MVGRVKEINELEDLYEKNSAELIAVYGRRRVGKTYLIEHTFKNRFSFKHAGLSPVEHAGNGLLELQLKHFFNSLTDYGWTGNDCPDNWLDAFHILQKLIEQKNDGRRQVIFIDELPWLDTKRSGFISAFEGFWNNWACHQDYLMIIVCGSANSWMMEKLINNHGGLYGRVTYEIKLLPFTLSECEEYFKDRNIILSRYDIAGSYMAIGGIPYYMGYFKKGLSLAQNIDNLFFKKDAKLRFEYERLFRSAFSNPELTKKVVDLLSKKNLGYMRSEITSSLKIKDGGAITSVLNALIASDFIIKYVPFGFSKKNEFYKLVDPFCLFFNKFVINNTSFNENYWAQNITSQSVVSWRGVAFENLCFNHIELIKSALGVAGVASEQSAWSKKPDDTEGTQIDLLISRNDNIINMCEIKFYNDDFSVDKNYYRTLLRRQELLSEAVPKTKVIHNTFITTFGLKSNEYSSIFTNIIVLDDLFGIKR